MEGVWIGGFGSETPILRLYIVNPSCVYKSGIVSDKLKTVETGKEFVKTSAEIQGYSSGPSKSFIKNLT